MHQRTPANSGLWQRFLGLLHGACGGNAPFEELLSWCGALSSRMLPPYVAVWPDNQPSIRTPPSVRFTWRPGARELGVSDKATPALLAELAQTGEIDGLTRLDVPSWSTAMSGLPPLPASVVRSLTQVHIDSSNFVDWGGLYQLPALRRLALGDEVTVAADGISRLRTLTHLTLRTKRLPADLAALPALTHLTIASSPISALPDDIGSLPLEELRLQATRNLKALPDTLGACKTLKAVETHQVPLETLPAALLTSTSLESLRVCGTRIVVLSGPLHWPALHTLRLTCGFREWPDSVWVPNLADVHLEGGFSKLPDLYNEKLINCAVYAPLASVDPRLAAVPSSTRGVFRLGLRLSCTQAAADQLSPAERAAFGDRLLVV